MLRLIGVTFAALASVQFLYFFKTETLGIEFDSVVGNVGVTGVTGVTGVIGAVVLGGTSFGFSDLEIRPQEISCDCSQDCSVESTLKRHLNLTTTQDCK